MKDQLILLLSKGTKKHLLTYYSKQDSLIPQSINIDALAYAIAQSFLEGLFIIIRNFVGVY